MDDIKASKEDLGNELYFNEHHLQVYFEDAVAQMFSCRLENPTSSLKPTKFLKEYFCSVHQGTHVLFRDFSFVSATPYNRLCAIKAIMQIYKPLLYKDETFNMKDYHSLLQLIWPDIPFDEVQSAFATVETLDQETEAHLSFLEFVTAMKNSFCLGDNDYEATIIDLQLKMKIEEFSKYLKQGSSSTANLSEADFLCSLEESGSEQTSMWSVATNIIPNNEFKRILCLRESNSFSSDEPVVDKLSRSSSGSKDASKSEQNVSTFSRASSASLRGRLNVKQLSNSLTVLQTEKLDGENNRVRRHRSKSAVAVQRIAQGRT